MERERSLSSPFEDACGTTPSKDGAFSKHSQAAGSPIEYFRDVQSSCDPTPTGRNHTCSVSPCDFKHGTVSRYRRETSEQNGGFHASDGQRLNRMEGYPAQVRLNPTQLSGHTTDANSAECSQHACVFGNTLSPVLGHSRITNGLALGQTVSRLRISTETRESTTSAKHTGTRNRRRVETNGADTKDALCTSSESKRLPGMKTAKASDNESTKQACKANHEKKGSTRKNKDHDRLQERYSKGNSNGGFNTNEHHVISRKKAYTDSTTEDSEEERPVMYLEQASFLTADESRTVRLKVIAESQLMETKSHLFLKLKPEKQTSDIKMLYGSGKQNPRETRSGIQRRNITIRGGTVAFYGDPESRDRTAVPSKESVSTLLETDPQGNQASVKCLRRLENTAESTDRMGIKEIHRIPTEGRQRRLRQARRHSALLGVSESIPAGNSRTTLNKPSQNQISAFQDNTRTNPDQAKRSGHAIQGNGIQSARPKQKAEESKHRQSEATSERYIKKTQ